MATEPPPRIVGKFEQIWRDWLYYLYEFIESHTGGSTPTPPATGLSWNAHGNIATGDASNPLIVDEGTFHVKGSAGTTPVDLDSGAGMAFIQSKFAFRAGKVPAGLGYWDNASIGNGSIGLGQNTWPTGSNSIAMGFETYATANNALAIGDRCQSTGSTGSVSIGSQSRSTSPNATAIGSVALATNSNAIALGSTSTASGLKSFSMGSFVQSTGTDGFTIGTGWGVGAGILNNPNDRTLWVALASDIPTLVMVNATGGTGTTGFIGIVEQAPLSTLDVGGSVGFAYSLFTGSNGGSDTLSDEYVVKVNMQSVTSGNTYTINLPALGPTTIDRRIYYIKIISLNGTWGGGTAFLAIQPAANDGVEDIASGGSPGTLLADNTPVNIGMSVSNRGASLTFIADNTSGGWWLI